MELRVYYWIARVFGIIFMMKLRDFFIRRQYASLSNAVPQAARVAKQEMNHIAALRNAMDEERLLYVGALVLGLNDAIIQVTGAIAGFTFALQSTTLIALAAIVVGVTGALSMASSEYLEKQSESAALSAAKAAGYTGGSYLLDRGNPRYAVFPVRLLYRRARMYAPACLDHYRALQRLQRVSV